MPIEVLKKLVPPPDNAAELGTVEQWQLVESQLGLRLPTDYRDFVSAYGSGLFGRFYRVYNPFARNEWTALIPSVKRVCGALREFKRDWPKEVPYPIYPEPGGVFPWGNDENGNDYYWLMSGAPVTWKVLANNLRGDGFREHPSSMTQFLTNVLTYQVKALAGGYPTDADRVFKIFKP